MLVSVEAMGGAVYCDAGPVDIVGGMFRNSGVVVGGAGKAYGGAVYGSTAAQVNDTLFESNSAAAGSSADGGM